MLIYRGMNIIYQGMNFIYIDVNFIYFNENFIYIDMNFISISYLKCLSIVTAHCALHESPFSCFSQMPVKKLSPPTLLQFLNHFGFVCFGKGLTKNDQ